MRLRPFKVRFTVYINSKPIEAEQVVTATSSDAAELLIRVQYSDSETVSCENGIKVKINSAKVVDNYE